MKRGFFKQKTYEEVLAIKLAKKVAPKVKISPTKRVSKPKKQSVSQLKKKLWTIFSLYIRTRDKFTCFTCGRVGESSGIHAGHFVPKSVGGIDLYFDEDNVHAQCYNCNINLGGNQYEYSKRLGLEKAEELYKRKGIYTKWTTETYLEKIQEYKSKYERLIQ